jgi:hypothetical protein
MFLGFVVLFTALTISSVAIYYSVAGLVAIFAAAALPIAIMGVALEVAKLVTTVWLHKFWNQSVWWLKTYLSISVVILMLITSMGIFGYLSKAHIEQTAQAEQGLQEIQRITTQITEYEADLVELKSDTDIIKNSGSSRDQEIQSQIDLEQQRIDSAYTRIQPAIDEQNSIISKEESRLGGSVTLYQEQIAAIDKNLSSIEANIASGNVEAVQALVGVEADGNLGPATERAIDSYRTAQSSERQRLTSLIATESKNITSPVIDAARSEIQRLRGLAEQEIAKSNELINRLRSQIGTANTSDIDQQVKINNEKIDKLNQRISELSDQKFKLETEYRKLEAEVGPIKYIAEFIYGESADKTLLEDAVRWVIVMIIFVFDPLAVLLLIASQYTFDLQRSVKVLPEVVSIKKTKNELPKSTTKKTRKRVDKTQRGTEIVDQVGEEETPKFDRSVESDTTNLTPEERHAILEETENMDSWKIAKKLWKEQNPDLNLKSFKDDFLRGRIDTLPWEPFVDNPGYVQNSEQAQETTLWSKIRDRNGSNNSNNSTGQTS